MQNFRVYESDQTFLVADGDQLTNVLHVHSIDELRLLQVRIGEYLDARNNSDWIDVAMAREMAAQRGKPISETGLRSALSRGNIRNAQKLSITGLAKTERGGQWRMPRAAFLVWLEERRA